MFLRALLAFLMVPVVVAGIIPFTISLFDPYRGTGSLTGGLFLIIGLAILLCCVRDFYVAGKGTLAPWDPPKHLVTVGLYRYVRNPMYVGVLLILSGWAIITGSPIVAGFALFMSSAFYFRVKLHEEPWAEQTFASEWQEYKNNVPGWLPRIKGYYPDKP